MNNSMVKNNINYNLILAVVNSGFENDVLNTAMAYNTATHGVLRAQIVDANDIGQHLGVYPPQGTQLIQIITKCKDRKAILDLLEQRYGEQSNARGIFFTFALTDIDEASHD